MTKRIQIASPLVPNASRLRMLSLSHKAQSLDELSISSSKIDRGVAFPERLLKEEGVIYGVTTERGDSCTVAIPPNLVDELPATFA